MGMIEIDFTIRYDPSEASIIMVLCWGSTKMHFLTSQLFKGPSMHDLLHRIRSEPDHFGPDCAPAGYHVMPLLASETPPRSKIVDYGLS